MQKEIERHIKENGVMNFMVGCHGNFDRYAASVLRVIKRKHPQIMLTLLLPFHPVEMPVEKPEWFDVAYHPTEMYNIPLAKRLEALDVLAVKMSEYMIAYAQEDRTRTSIVVKRARKHGVNVTLLPNM